MISGKGAVELSKADWNQLQLLDLGIPLVKEMTMTLEKRALLVLPKETGSI